MMGAMSTIYGTEGCDNGKPEKADTQSRMPAAMKPESLSYGVISQTTPAPYEPPLDAVP